jgi:hypothetical protein
MNNDLLKFSYGNAKLSKDTLIFSLPSGHSCPFAKDCLSKANRITGKVTDGKDTKFRCYATSSESAFPSVRKQRWHNFDLLKSKDWSEMVGIIEASLNAVNLKKIKLVRIHESGDFFNQDYFDAWITIAQMYKDLTFYAYTKSIQYWIKRKEIIPSNLKLTASYGGRQDASIATYKLKSNTVVFSTKEAKDKNLKVDHNDKLAWSQDESFAVLLHGTQPKDSKASEAIKTMKANGTKFSYGKGNK